MGDVPTYRYYLLDSNGSIIVGAFLDSADLNAAIVEAHHNCSDLGYDRVYGLEVWQETTLLYQGRRDSSGSTS